MGIGIDIHSKGSELPPDQFGIDHNVTDIALSYPDEVCRSSSGSYRHSRKDNIRIELYGKPLHIINQFIFLLDLDAETFLPRRSRDGILNRPFIGIDVQQPLEPVEIGVRPGLV